MKTGPRASGRKGSLRSGLRRADAAFIAGPAASGQQPHAGSGWQLAIERTIPGEIEGVVAAVGQLLANVTPVDRSVRRLLNPDHAAAREAAEEAALHASNAGGAPKIPPHRQEHACRRNNPPGGDSKPLLSTDGTMQLGYCRCSSSFVTISSIISSTAVCVDVLSPPLGGCT